jgi:predicted dehydrogenase
VGSLPEPLRLGILGAARIAPSALVRPATRVDGVEVLAVAARDVTRAGRFAAKQRIPRVHSGYDALLADPEIEAVYNPLPNGLHCEWTLRALAAGKHVLCEKPLASNEEEARRMAEAAERAGLVLMEAFHWRYHPLAARLREIIDSGELGAVRHIDVATCVPMPLPGNIRFRYELGGGSMMDIGSYAVHILRFLAGSEPEVISAEARFSSPDVDRWMRAEHRFPDGTTGTTTASLMSARLLQISAKVEGESGRLSVFNPLAPHVYHHVRVKTRDGSRTERVAGDATYTCQLRAFRDAIRTGTPPATDGWDGVANMRVIDSVYRKAGMKVRGT